MSKCWYCNNELTTGDNPKHFGICNKCYDEMFKSSNTIIRSFTNKISDLEAKLAEKSKENATLEAMLVENANDRKTMQEFKIGEDGYDLTDEDARNSLCWEVEELKQQLTEKNKEIEKLKHFKVTIGTMENNQVDISSTTYIDKDKISFCIEKFQETKKSLRDKVCLMENDEHCYLQNAIYWQDVVAIIDNQIASLKKGVE